MTGSDSSDGEAKQEKTSKPETTLLTIKIRTRVPRRQLTLASITICLNILLWCSVSALITSLYLITSDPGDSTNTPTEVLTIISSFTSIAYIVLHTIFSLKQRIWKHQGRHPSFIQRASYIAVRFSVTLCVLWLFTAGWNLITVARQPVCLHEAPGLQGWQAGTPCLVGRVGIAVSLLALFAACTLFGLLAAARRPFEAHVFKVGYRKHPQLNPKPTPAVSRSASSNFEQDARGRVSVSTYRSSPSNISNTDIETLDLNSHSPPVSTTNILAPSPRRALISGIFTSQAQPPPLPAAFAPPSLRTSLDLAFQPPSRPPSAFSGHGSVLPVFHPSASTSYIQLPPPPRMSTLVSPSGFVPLSIPAQYTASAWRAVHPPLRSPLGPASRSYTHLPLHHRRSSGNLSSTYGHSFSYRNRYSRSSVSLTRPHRLSSAPTTSVTSGGMSSRSTSAGPSDEHSSSSASGSGNEQLDANAIAYAILNGTKIPGHDLTNPKQRRSPDSTESSNQSKGKEKAMANRKGHARHSSAPADTMSGALPPVMEILSWNPAGSGRLSKLELPPLPPLPIRDSILDGRRGAGKGPPTGAFEPVLGSKFSADSSPDSSSTERDLRAAIERELDKRHMQQQAELKRQQEEPNRKVSGNSTSTATSVSTARQYSTPPASTSRTTTPKPGTTSTTAPISVPKDEHEDTQAGSPDSTAEAGKHSHEEEGEGKGKGKGKRNITPEKYQEVKNKPLPKIAAL